jgi:hypothetical protein
LWEQCILGKKRGEGRMARDEEFSSSIPVFPERLVLFKALIFPFALEEF